MTPSLTEAVARWVCRRLGDGIVPHDLLQKWEDDSWPEYVGEADGVIETIKASGFAIVPNANNMTDEQAEAICELAPVCGGMAHSVYHAALKAAGHDDYARPGAGE